MKKSLLSKLLFALSFVFLLSTVGLKAQIPIWALDFESAGGYTTSISEFTDGDADYFLRTDGSDISTSVEFSNLLGSYFFAAMDIDGEGASLPVEINIENIDISGLGELTFGIYLAEDVAANEEEDWDDSDYVHIYYDIDNSGTFKDLLFIENDGSQYNSAPYIDTDFNGTGDGTEITSVFTPFTAGIVGTGNDLDIKIVFYLNSGDEDIALDNIQILGPDPDPPVAIFIPADNATGIYVTSQISIAFNEAIRNIDDSEITDANVSSLLTFKETDVAGTDVAFTPSIDVNKKIITIVPDSYLSNNQVYYVAIAPVEDASDNSTTGENISFTTIDGASKEIAVEIPEGGGTYYAGEPATIEWYSNNVTTVNIDAWVPSEDLWVPMVINTPSDGIETFTVPADAMYSDLYKIRVIDVSDALVFGVSPTFTVISTPAIYDIQSTITVGDASDYSGHIVRTSGVVTAIDGGNFWIQDGAGAWNGIVCYDNTVAGMVTVGDDITVEAGVAEYTTTGSSLTELVNISDLVTNSTGNVLPVATVITTGDYAEDFEGVLVEIVSADVVNPDAGNGEFIINDGSGDLIVDDKIYAYTATANETIGVTGIGHDEYGDKILPRSASDIVDLTTPTFTSVPGDTDIDVAIDASIVLTFNEAIRNIDDSEVTDANVGALLTLKKTDIAGEDVPFTATIDVEKKVITVVANNDFDFSQLYYAAIAPVEDTNDNAMDASGITFTTVADLVAPIFTSVPNDEATDVAIDATITISFDEAIRNIDDSEITDANVASLISFKETDDAGADVAFTATIDAAKKVITITSSANLTYLQLYYLAISAVEDEYDNATTPGSFTFTTADNPSSINGLQNNTLMEIYPNPNNGRFMLKVGTEKEMTLDIEIMNIQGQVVFRNRIHRSESFIEVIDISDVAAGLYFIRIADGKSIKVEKIQIN